MLADEGWSTAQIAQALRIHETSVLRHIDEYQRTQKLSKESGGSSSYLSESATQELIEHLTHKTYLHTYQIVIYIKETYGVVYTVSGLNKWLHQHGFTYKKPKGVPHKFDPDKQAEFIKKYEELKSTVSEDKPIVFMDAVHPTQATKITSGWIKKGTDKPIETTGSRTRLNIYPNDFKMRAN